ncbi:MAG: hypothetical protein AAFV45_06835 [Pseudomonadota bacterium]
MPLTRSDVIWAYRLILGREPDNEDVIAHHAKMPSLAALRRALLRSPEFQRRLPFALADPPGRNVDFERAPIVFLHIPKCAGTSLHAVLASQPAQVVCGERHNGLGNWPVGHLAECTLFSGHFDYHSLRLIPAEQLRIVTTVRRPAERLISLYRFLRAHTPAAVEASGQNMRLCGLARKHDPVAFFRHPALALHPSINNGMVRQLTEALPQKRWEAFVPGRTYGGNLADRDPTAAVALASTRLEGMTAFGLQEQMDLSIRHIMDALGLSYSEEAPRKQVLETLVARNPLLQAVGEVIVDQRLAEAMRPHTELDDALYSFACALFNQRTR